MATVARERRSGVGHWRKMTWVLVAWCAAIIVWAISGAAKNAQVVQQCVHQFGQQFQTNCQSGANLGTGLGVMAILFVGFVGFCFFSIIWFMTRPRETR